MKLPIRMSVALDEETAEILESLRSPGTSQSDVVRRALRFYNSFKDLRGQDLERIRLHEEMLSSGEHVILDLDHLVAFLDVVEKSDSQDFWEVHRKISRNHAEQLQNASVENILRRLESCNFFRMSKSGEDQTLVFGNEAVKKFMRLFLEEIFKGLNKDVEIKEDLSKLRVRAVKKLR